MEADFKALQDAVGGLNLSAAQRHVIFWCLGQLPALYQAFSETYELRYKAQIGQLVQQVIHQLTSDPEARLVAEVVIARLSAMHERLGIPGPAFTAAPAPAKKTRAKRKAS